MGLGSPLLLLLASATSQWALVRCKSVVSARLRNAPLGCLARVLGLPRSLSATRVTPAVSARSVRVFSLRDLTKRRRPPAGARLTSHTQLPGHAFIRALGYLHCCGSLNATKVKTTAEASERGRYEARVDRSWPQSSPPIRGIVRRRASTPEAPSTA